jgi:hypothetical protein
MLSPATEESFLDVDAIPGRRLEVGTIVMLGKLPAFLGGHLSFIVQVTLVADNDGLRREVIIRQVLDAQGTRLENTERERNGEMRRQKENIRTALCNLSILQTSFVK